MEWIEKESLSVVYLILTVVPFLAGIIAGIKAAERRNKAVGWVVGILIFLVVGVFFYPVIELLERRGCEINPEFEECSR